MNTCPGTWLGSLPGREGVGSVVGGADDRNRTALSQTSVLSKVQALSPQVTVASSRCQARLLPGPCSSHQVSFPGKVLSCPAQDRLAHPLEASTAMLSCAGHIGRGASGHQTGAAAGCILHPDMTAVLWLVPASMQPAYLQIRRARTAVGCSSSISMWVRSSRGVPQAWEIVPGWKLVLPSVGRTLTGPMACCIPDKV